jgi:hypothetical protein
MPVQLPATPGSPKVPVPVPFPDTTMPGIKFAESSGRIINGYVEPLGAGAPAQLVHRRAPGLRNFGTTVQAGFRGGVDFAGTIYAAFANRLVFFSEAGGAANDIGILAGTHKGFFARNNKTPTPDLLFCDPDGNYASFTTSSITPNFSTATMPAPNSVCAIDGFFVFTIGDGRFFASDVNSTNIQALSFGTAEAKADALIRSVTWSGNLFLFGAATTEVWNNAGTTPFPFARQLVIPRGIAGAYCVAGFEDNFSRALVWVADDNTVVQLNGYVPQKISPPDLDGLIEQVADKSTLEMNVFVARGHAFLMLSSPTWSWVYDLNLGKWAERMSYLSTRSRITGGFYAGTKWLCGDTGGGNIQEISDAVQTEVDPASITRTKPFRWRLESGAVENFPVGSRVGRFDAQFVTGVGIATAAHSQAIVSVASAPSPSTAIRVTISDTAGMINGNAVNIAGVVGTTEANGTWPINVVDSTHIDLVGTIFAHAYLSGGVATYLAAIDPIETDPVVEISWSDDGGQTYYAPLLRKLGRQSLTRQLVSLIACTGRSTWVARRWRIDVTDPVHVGFMGAWQNIGSRASDVA